MRRFLAVLALWVPLLSASAAPPDFVRMVEMELKEAFKALDRQVWGTFGSSSRRAGRALEYSEKGASRLATKRAAELDYAYRNNHAIVFPKDLVSTLGKAADPQIAAKAIRSHASSYGVSMSPAVKPLSKLEESIWNDLRAFVKEGKTLPELSVSRLRGPDGRLSPGATYLAQRIDRQIFDNMETLSAYMATLNEAILRARSLSISRQAAFLANIVAGMKLELREVRNRLTFQLAMRRKIDEIVGAKLASVDERALQRQFDDVLARLDEGQSAWRRSYAEGGNEVPPGDSRKGI